ncbi:hypothetical protein TUM17576_52920 [Enterobacter hormaechei]|nr:hypothetical protein TUM17576_52920 [Enterobacter hormaechei]
MFAGKKSAQIREILISESAWEEMTCLFAPSLEKYYSDRLYKIRNEIQGGRHQQTKKNRIRFATLRFSYLSDVKDI